MALVVECSLGFGMKAWNAGKGCKRNSRINAEPWQQRSFALMESSLDSNSACCLPMLLWLGSCVPTAEPVPALEPEVAPSTCGGDPKLWDQLPPGGS